MAAALQIALLALLLSSCAHIRISVVQDADTLFFGTNRPGGVVTDEEWRDFVDHVIVPSYPGFTEWQAIGHWRTERENTHVVMIVHPHGSDRDIDRIISEYKKRFQQEAVFWIRGPAVVPID